MPGEGGKREGEVTRCDIEERAAILQEGCGVSRDKAEALTARMYGSKTWNELLEGLKQ